MAPREIFERPAPRWAQHKNRQNNYHWITDDLFWMRVLSLKHGIFTIGRHNGYKLFVFWLVRTRPLMLAFYRGRQARRERQKQYQ